MKTIFNVLFTIFLITICYAQKPGEPYYPETANGASNIYFQNHTLRWQNPEEAVYNEIYLSFDSTKVASLDTSAIFISGYPSTLFNSVVINKQLHYPTRYFWCVVEYNADGFTPGEVWSFTTTIEYIDFAELDDFSFDINKWEIITESNIGWQLGEEINYDLPAPSTGNVLTADASNSNDPINSTAYFHQINSVIYLVGATLEFNSDWKTENINDSAIVEMTTDMGNSWSQIWSKNGVSDRSKHIQLTLFDNWLFLDTIATVQVRFRTIQNGTNSWWAIDNVSILGNCGILTHSHPVGLNVNVIQKNKPEVKLQWYQSLPNPFEKIERKNGIPSDTNSYQIIASLSTSYTTTFIDSTIDDTSVYTYRIGNNEGSFVGPWYVYSNEATVYVFSIVPVELISFTGNVIDGQVHLNWITATETNNYGFEVQRKGTKSGNNETGWKKIGFVEGHGTTAETNYYSFNHKELQYGKYYYRLKQIDFNGSFEYSNVVEVKIGIPDRFGLSQNYPNPFNPTTKISWQSSIGSRQTLKVIDILGKEVKTLVDEIRPAGNYEVDFDGTGLPSGVYFYQLKAGSYIEIRKMILMK